VLGGNSSPDAAAINKILGSVGIEGDSEKINKLIAELKGKDVYEVIAAGQSKLANVSFGGAAAAPAPAAAPAKEEKGKKEALLQELDGFTGLGYGDGNGLD
jgi:large subunit ribosomal protein LP2